MDGSAFRGLGEFFWLMIVIICVTVPLAFWKLIDIVWWLVTHVRIVIT